MIFDDIDEEPTTETIQAYLYDATHFAIKPIITMQEQERVIREFAEEQGLHIGAFLRDTVGVNDIPDQWGGVLLGLENRSGTIVFADDDCLPPHTITYDKLLKRKVTVGKRKPFHVVREPTFGRDNPNYSLSFQLIGIGREHRYNKLRRAHGISSVPSFTKKESANLTLKNILSAETIDKEKEA